MKTFGLEKTSLDSCIIDAQQERVVVTRAGKPVALIMGIDEEQLAWSKDYSFWQLIQERRSQDTISREELESLTGSA